MNEVKNVLIFYDTKTYCVNCVHKYLPKEICCIEIAYFWNSLSKEKQEYIHFPYPLATKKMGM